MYLMSEVRISRQKKNIANLSGVFAFVSQYNGIVIDMLDEFFVQ